MTRRYVRFVAAWAPPVVLMAVIFWFSSQPSPSLSTDATVDVLMKKGGHATGYALLAIALLFAVAWAMGGSGRPPVARRAYAWAFAIAVVYGATDELHQAFVATRSPSVVDVAIDALGAIVGLSLFALWRARKAGGSEDA